jgi:hypothetical protein
MRTLAIGLVLLFAATLSGQRQSDVTANVDAVILRDGTRSVVMKPTEPTRSGRWGIGSGKQYYVFRGARATLRLTNATPEFEFYADPGQVAADVILFKFETHADRREIKVAGGFGGFAIFKIPKDRIVSTILEEMGDGPNSTRHYRMKPTMALRPGEYCLAQNSVSYYDFGVD